MTDIEVTSRTGSDGWTARWSSPTRTDRRAGTRSPSRGRSSNGWRRGADDPVDLVRRSFAFLLEREPKESILRSFDLPVIGRYFPDYERTITS